MRPRQQHSSHSRCEHLSDPSPVLPSAPGNSVFSRGLCFAKADCMNRTGTVLGSSTQWPPNMTDSSNVLSATDDGNPFGSFNKVWVPYGLRLGRLLHRDFHLECSPRRAGHHRPQRAQRTDRPPHQHDRVSQSDARALQRRVGRRHRSVSQCRDSICAHNTLTGRTQSRTDCAPVDRAYPLFMRLTSLAAVLWVAVRPF
jgi:hypothetical protein